MDAAHVFGAVVSAGSAALAGRVAAERMMTDTVLIRRRTGWGPINETTGVKSPTYLTVYTGKCRIQSYQPFESTPVAGGQQFTVQRTALHIPVTVLGVAIDDVAIMQTSPMNPALVGRAFRIAGLHHKTNQTSQRLMVDELVES
jgi:hypothetical protein